MKKESLSLAVILYLAYFCILPQAYAYEMEEFLPLRKGNRWLYSVAEGKDHYQLTAYVSEEVVAKNGRVVKVICTDNNLPQSVAEYTFLIKPRGIFILEESDSSGSKVFSPYVPYLIKLPLNKLNKSRFNFLFCDKINNCVSGRGLIDLKLGAIEDVRGPAGFFKDCLRFDYVTEEFIGDSKSIINKCSDWYSRGMGKVKTLCFESVKENGSQGVVSTVSEELLCSVVNGGADNSCPKI